LVQERQWAEHIKNMDFDAIYTGQCRTWTEPPLLRFLPPELPITHYCQEPKRTFHEKRFLEERQRWPFWKKWWRLPTVRWMQDQMDFNIRHARQVFCNSDFSKLRIEQAYPKLICQTQVIGVDTQTFSPDLSSEIKPQIITVGALDPSKNHGFAIDVAAQKPGGKKLNIIVITDRSYGDTAEQLKHKAKELDVTLDIRVRVSTQELVQLYRESLATVYTPIEEPFGIVSIESQACGTPVLGVDEGGIKETLLHGVGGFRLSRNAEHFAEHLKDWIEQPISREKISLQAREHILKHWSKDACLASIIDRIESILKNP
jgi:glycosyltransferase involved in cell wall biosynthesis